MWIRKIDLKGGRNQLYGQRRGGILLLVDKRRTNRLHKRLLQRGGTFVATELTQMLSVRALPTLQAYSPFFPHKHRHHHINNYSFH